MSRIYIFGDESGNLDFRRVEGASRYFMIGTVVLCDCGVGSDLLELKRQLHWEGYPVGDYFHATTDKQAVRDEVFNILGGHDLRFDATILEKSKAMPHLIRDHNRFYKEAWYLHLKHLVPKIAADGDEVFLVAASIGTNAKRNVTKSALEDVIAQVALGRRHKVAHWPAATDPCIQVADYCCWAVQRKWERNDVRSHVLIAGKIRSEFDAFALSTTHYY